MKKSIDQTVTGTCGSGKDLPNRQPPGVMDRNKITKTGTGENKEEIYFTASQTST